ncbi:MAG: hypothetical protein KDD35_11985, partial [Bdellovibrionales bacterium]|nr:hypothetical protein [Bdellovibrionales bacterium]
MDVGNMTLAAIPQTYASMSYPSSWSSAANENLLSIQNRSGSVIVARRSEIKDLSSPSAVSIQQYMKARYPDRTYNIIYINGLEGIRADLVDSEGSKQSDIYLVSELKDFIHIKSDLKKEDNGIKSGDQIILTVGVEYKGVPYPNSQPKKVTVPSFETFGYRSGTYSMLGDCYTYVDSGCKGVSFVFANGGGTGLSVGRAGYDHGRLIELGPESQVPFDEIKIEGKYLLAPVSKVLLSDIYTVFTPENPQQEQDSINLKEGYVYLVRTISWPSEDLISKIRVDRIEAGKSLTVTYSKLAYVEPKELQKQVEIINKYTLEREKPLATGEVTLYNRSFWNNYFFASFNFEFSTSGNMFITHNGWDLLFGNGGVSKPTFTVPFSSHSFGQVIDTGSKDLDEITLSDYPDPNTFERKSDPEVIVGHTYIVYQYDYEGRVIY